MRRIDRDETEPTAASLGQGLLRMVVGVVSAGRGLDGLIHLRAFQGELIQHSVPRPETVAVCIVALELLAGFGLLFGRFTRTAAFALLCDTIAKVVMLFMNPGWLSRLPAIETAGLLAACAVFFVAAGGGHYGADAALRRRARLKALAGGERWSCLPYAIPNGAGAGQRFDPEASQRFDPEASQRADSRRSYLRPNGMGS